MSEQTNQSEYILLFRGKEWHNGLSAEELQTVMGQIKSWFDRLIQEGKMKDSRPLGYSGAVVSGKNGRNVSDGPFAESKEAVGGFVLLQVGSIEEAISIAKACPVLTYGNEIEVRPVPAECPTQARIREILRESALATA